MRYAKMYDMNPFLIKTYKGKEYFFARAKEEFVKAPLSRVFADKHGLSASSSVARAVKALLDKGLIIESRGLGLSVYNVFVLKNLQKLY